jgi:hypothetical protein
MSGKILKRCVITQLSISVLSVLEAVGAFYIFKNNVSAFIAAIVITSALYVLFGALNMVYNIKANGSFEKKQ